MKTNLLKYLTEEANNILTAISAVQAEMTRHNFSDLTDSDTGIDDYALDDFQEVFESFHEQLTELSVKSMRSSSPTSTISDASSTSVLSASSEDEASETAFTDELISIILKEDESTAYDNLEDISDALIKIMESLDTEKLSGAFTSSLSDLASSIDDFSDSITNLAIIDSLHKDDQKELTELADKLLELVDSIETVEQEHSDTTDIEAIATAKHEPSLTSTAFAKVCIGESKGKSSEPASAEYL